MAQDSGQLWGPLVKALTKKIEVPRFGPQSAMVDPVRGLLMEGSHDNGPPPQRRTSDGSLTNHSMPAVSATTPAAATSDACIDRVAAHLGYVSRQVIERYLELHGDPKGAVSRRLLALGIVPEGTHAPATTLWWTAVARGWLQPEMLGEILRSSPGMPRHNGETSLVDYLLESEVASYKEIKAADLQALEAGRPITVVLAETGKVTEAKAADLSAGFFRLERAPPGKLAGDAVAAMALTPELASAFDVVPVSADGGRLALLSVADPGPILFEALKRITGRDVVVFIDTLPRLAQERAAWEASIERSRVENAARVAAVAVQPARAASKRLGRSVKGNFRLDQDSFVGINSPPDMARLLMERATGVSATDIHLEPQEGKMRVRFRLDGICYDVTTLRLGFGEEVLSRIKVMADMDITERRKAQDGHLHLELAGEPYDFRIATVPTSRGERMSVRITAGSREVPNLTQIGLEEDEHDLLDDFTHRSHGIVLACGPVGSGKTTTLYACLGNIDASQKNIMTIEDPVEIELPNVSQVPVNYKIGMDFSHGLRSLLRQDPNIILVGEVRDDETAKVAVRASLTGLLVFSTIHANSAPGAVTTLYNFDIPPFLLSTSLVGVVAQRLVRTICPSCREVYNPDPRLLAQAGLPAAAAVSEPTPSKAKAKKVTIPPPDATGHIYIRGRGCDACYGTGYQGRAAIFEILDVRDEMRVAISERAPEIRLREMALAGGMRTLADRGREKVLRGQTTVEEFVRVLHQ